MNEAAPTAEQERLRAAGLSPTLLQHAGSGQPFLGFISYRRGDALPLARWLRDRITGFKAPVELKDKIAAHDASAVSGQPFLGFISYRRGDALPLARWLRDRITGFKAPVELKDKIAAHDASAV